ncbi:MAG: hypothetical protein QNK24_16720 [Desulfuromusa sp.]|nr:hypothetical protein [Desulfuromusa sp.]
MNKLKILGIVLFFGVIMAFGSEIGELLSVPGAQHLLPTVEARVGRPLTPVSVAGVARRTVRRCAVGVYNCKLTEPQPTYSLLWQTSSKPLHYKRHQLDCSFRPTNVRQAGPVARQNMALLRI